jgi:hypothetical protein
LVVISPEEISSFGLVGIYKFRFAFGLRSVIVDRVIPLELRKNISKNSVYPLCNFCGNICVRLESHVQVFYQKIQVRCAFGLSSIIFDRVILLELRKNTL